MCPAAASENVCKIFRIGTGGTAGVYYPIGKLIAWGMTGRTGKDGRTDNSTGVADCIAVAQTSAGSVENVRTIVKGETEAGLVQADVASMAYTLSGEFKGQKETQKLRAIASLYPEKFHIVVRKDARIRVMNDLRRKRISLDESGSGTLAVMRIILSAHNLNEKQLQAVYLKPSFLKEKMISGDIQGFVMMAGTPLKSVLDLSDVGLTLLPIPQKTARKINSRYPYLVPGTIEPDVYPGIDRTPTLQVYALLVVSTDLDADLVYRVTQALWSRRTQEHLTKGHLRGASIRLETALTGISIPLHEGAARFYRQKGVLKQ